MSADFRRWLIDTVCGQDLRSHGGERPNNSMQRTAQRAAADAERYAD
jgi:hypothetical protein